MKRTVWIAAVLLLSIPFVGQAQRMAYVDVNAILESIPEYRKAQETLDNLATQWRQEIAKEQDEIKGMYSKYQAEVVLMSEDMKKQREDEIMKKESEVRDLQRSRFGPEGALFKKRSELVKPIQDRVYNAIAQFADDKGFEFIFEKGSASGMLFADPKYDKTDDIKDMLSRN